MKRFLLKFGLATALAVVVVATGLSNQAARLAGHTSTGLAFAGTAYLPGPPCEPQLGEIALYRPVNGYGCVMPGQSGTDYDVNSSPPTQDSSGNLTCPSGQIVVVAGETQVAPECIYLKSKPVLLNISESDRGYDSSNPGVIKSTPLTQAVQKGDCTGLSSGGSEYKYCADATGFLGNQGSNCPTVATPGLSQQINCATKNPIYGLLEFALNWMIKLLLVLAVLAVVVSGIQYIISQGNPDGLRQAKSRLTNAIVGIILLSLMFVILRFLGVV